MRIIKLCASIAALNVAATASASLSITTVYDGPLSGGIPKGVELQALTDIDDLSIYGIGSANNGGGSDGEEFTFPSISLTAGDVIYVASESTGFEAFFGFAPDYTTSAMAINGDDAIEVFQNGIVIDVFGDINTDGSGEDWEYMDGWAHRTIPAVSTTFNIGDWTFSGRNALDGATNNEQASSPIPISGAGDGTDPVDPEPELILISQIQGNPDTYGTNGFGDTDVSPLLGDSVTIEGVVVGDFQDGDADESRNLRGFYVQEETTDEDGNPLSSEGIFVFDGSLGVDVNLGDKVRVSGTVDQFFGETQIENVTQIEVIGSEALSEVSIAEIQLEDNTVITVDGNDRYVPDLEAYEGMLVTITDTLTIIEQFQLDRFNEIRVTAGDRPWQFTQQNLPDETLYPLHLQEIGARSIVYDDGLSQQNANINNLDGFGPEYTTENAKRMGDQAFGLTGILDYKWAGNGASSATWRLRAHTNGVNHFTSTATGDSPNPRQLTPDSLEGNLKVASFNVLNFFTTLDNGSSTTAVGQSPRGADDLSRFGDIPATAEFDRQLAKLVSAIIAMDADILGLVELENEFDNTNDGSTAIEVLVNAVNAELGSDVYDYVYPGEQFVGTDAIAVGVIYKPAVVIMTENTAPAILDDTIAADLDVFSGRDFTASPIFDGAATNRVPMAVSFTHLASNDSFTIAVNHFKSKGPSGLEDELDPNFDQGNGAGFWNQRRLDASIAVNNWLNTFPTGLEDSDLIIMGDLNAYAMEEPVQYLIGNGYNNVESTDTYSFVFDGQIGTLDYLLVSDALFEKFNAATVWSINADEADAIDYNLDFGRSAEYYSADNTARNSDHDPVIAAFNLVSDVVLPSNILTALNTASAEGTIAGTYRFWPRLALFRFYLILYKADFSYENGNLPKACAYLYHADRVSDGESYDLVEGDGVAAINRMINTSRQQICQ